MNKIERVDLYSVVSFCDFGGASAKPDIRLDEDIMNGNPKFDVENYFSDVKVSTCVGGVTCNNHV